MIERRTVFKAVAAVSAAALAAACSGSSNDGTATPQGSGGDKGAAPAAPVAKITATPAAGAKDADVRTPVVVKVSDGKLTDVKVTNEAGKAVKGELSADGLTWTSSESLGYGKTYSYAAKATGTDQRPAEFTGSFATLNPAKQLRATLNPADNAQVGVAMPISVTFKDGAPKDRVAVEKALKIKTSKDVEGSWGWISPSQVDWRPKEYWPANITVEVEANLLGVHLGDGVYGKSDVTTKFKIGRNQVVKIHTPDHVMKVYRGGAESASYPCSNGLDSVTDRNTPNGTFIIMSKQPHAVFDNARYGYTNVNKKWACRFSNHGEFIHENQDNAAAIGKTNNSHGCVNLLEADAKAYFDSALVGDPVEVTGSNMASPTGSDVKDWLYDWPTWKTFSAVK